MLFYLYPYMKKTEEEEVRLHMQFDINNKEHRNKLACETAFFIMNKGYREVKKFVDIPVDFVTEGGFELGKIWKALSEQFRQGKLSDDSIRFLLGLKKQFFDSPKKDLKKWMDRAQEVQGYYKKHGTLSMPNTQKFSNGMSMFQWVHHQKALYKRGELSPYQKKRLEEMGIQWIKPKKVIGWDEAYQYAKIFYNENGHLFVDRGYIVHDGFELGRWIQIQRDMYLGMSQYCLSEEQIEMLEDIGMFWEDIEIAKWDWFVGLLRECIRNTKKPFVISKNYRYKNYALGEQVNKVILQYGEGRLTRVQEKDLRDTGFKFSRVIK